MMKIGYQNTQNRRYCQTEKREGQEIFMANRVHIRCLRHVAKGNAFQ